MDNNDIYNYLKNTSLMDIIKMISKNENINIESRVDIYYTAKDLYRLYPRVFSKYKLDKYIKEEYFPVIKQGKNRLFLKSDVEEWLKSKSNNYFNGRI